MEELPRLIYLADEYRIQIPQAILRYVPQGELVQTIAIKGLNEAILDGKLPREQLVHLWTQGQRNGHKKKSDNGSPDEFRILVGQIASNELDLRRDDLDFSEYLALMRGVHDYVAYGGDELVATAEVDLSENITAEPLAKFNSGLEPLDLVTGGLYQGIITLIGKTGHGKTSFMLSIMEMLRRTNYPGELWFFEVEIPMNLMLWRTQAMRKRTRFVEGDKFKTGNLTTKEILDALHDDPNPDRILFVDGPDSMAIASGDGKRFAIEAVYRDLLRIKELSKMVVVSSQSRRKDGAITMESVAEAWLKTWYSDIVLGIQKLGRAPRGWSQCRLNVLKNRFGVEGREVQFQYNLANLDWDIRDSDVNELEEEEDW